MTMADPSTPTDAQKTVAVGMSLAALLGAILVFGVMAKKARF